MFTFEISQDKLNLHLKRQNQLVIASLIGIITLFSWYFFVKKYTYEFEINTPLDKAILVEILNKTYPATHSDLGLVEVDDEEVFIFRFKDEEVSFLQEIKIHDKSLNERKISIGVNAQARFFKERFDRFHKETLVQAFNRFLLLQLDKEIALKESAFQ